MPKNGHRSFVLRGRRPSAERRRILRRVPPLDNELWLCFVADGQGGRSGGAAAARLACEVGLSIAVGHKPAELVDPSTWPGILRRADAAVAADSEAGFTTLVGLCVNRDRVVGASSGDSAALLIGRGNAVQLTKGQQKNPPVGSGNAVAIPFAAALQAPWRVVMMSDGVWKYVGWDRVIDVASRESGEAIIANLEQLARLPRTGAFQDDFTVVMFEVSTNDEMHKDA